MKPDTLKPRPAFVPRPRPYVLIVTYADGLTSTIAFLTEPMRTEYMKACIDSPRVTALKRYNEDPNA